MTYKEKYFEIINNGYKTKPENLYTEKHHIIPRSVCILLDKSQDNLVYLTAKNHFLAHYYIWKWFRDELHDKIWSKKMCFAFNMMKRIIAKTENIDELSKLYEEVRKDFIEAHKGKKHTEEQKRKISESHKGKPKSEIAKLHMRKPKSEIAKLHMSESHKGKTLTEETRKKLSESHKGKTLTEETRKKLSQALKGEKNPNYGKHLSIETRKKLSETQIKYPVLQYSKDGELIRECNSITDAGLKLGINRGNISLCCLGKRKSAGGFVFKYKEEKTEK